MSGRGGKAGTTRPSPRQWTALLSCETWRRWVVTGTWGQCQENNATAFGRVGPEHSHDLQDWLALPLTGDVYRQIYGLCESLLSCKMEINIMPTSQDNSWDWLSKMGKAYGQSLQTVYRHSLLEPVGSQESWSEKFPVINKML